MQDDPLSCDRAHPFRAEHLQHCDACLEACLEESLRHPAEPAVPERFSERVLASLPAAQAPVRTPWDLWPALAACLPALLGAGLWWSGSVPDLRHPAVLATAGALEMAFALLWAVRTESSDL